MKISIGETAFTNKSVIILNTVRTIKYLWNEYLQN